MNIIFHVYDNGRYFCMNKIYINYKLSLNILYPNFMHLVISVWISEETNARKKRSKIVLMIWIAWLSQLVNVICYNEINSYTNTGFIWYKTINVK